MHLETNGEKLHGGLQRTEALGMYAWGVVVPRFSSIWKAAIHQWAESGGVPVKHARVRKVCSQGSIRGPMIGSCHRTAIACIKLGLGSPQPHKFRSC